MVILVGGEKGGPGKTTIAVNLAAMRLLNKRDALLIDTDRQHTASFWCSTREEKGIAPRIPSVQKFDKAVCNETMDLRARYDDIILDAGGHDSLELRSALLAADKAIIPLRPSQFDLWTLQRMSTLVEQAKQFNKTLRAFVVINQASTNPQVKELQEAQDLIQEFEHLTLLKTFLCERIVYRRAAMKGLSVVEYLPPDAKAIDEMTRLYQEVCDE